ncbi:hypothetical protein HDU76_013062, partial [Blyttiomyces sp. JEL0837]
AITYGIASVSALPSGVNRRDDQVRDFSHPACAICSYGHNNIQHKFYAAAYSDTGKPIESLEEFIEAAGVSFHGHRLCCDFDEPQDVHNITNSFGHIRQIRLSDAQQVSIEKFDPAAPTRRDTSTANTLTQFIQQPPTCVPLLSSHPLFNPYNDILTPSGSATRTLLAYPYYVKKSVTCPETATEDTCSVQLSDTITTTTSLSYSISDSNSNSFTNSIGTTSSVGTTSEAMQSISQTLEKSNQFTHTNSQGGSQSSTWSHAITKTSESQTSWSNTHTNEKSNSNTVTADTQQSQTQSRENGGSSSTTAGFDAKASYSETAGVQAGFEGFGASVSETVSVEAGISASHTDGSTWSVTGSSSSSSSLSQAATSQTSSSDSSTSGGSRSDSLSDAITNSKTSETNYQTSDSSSSGNSQSNTIGKTNSFGTSKTLSDELQKTYQTAQAIDTTHSNTNETSLSFTVSIQTPIKAGTSYDVVYLTQATFTQVPWICKQNGQDVIIVTDMADLSFTHSTSKSLTLLAPDEPPNYFQFDDNYLNSATVSNSITSDTTILVNKGTTAGSDVTGGKLLVMFSKSYEVYLSGFGAMYVKKKDVNGRIGNVVWDTRTNVRRSTDQVVNNVLYNNGNVRFLIDDMGHMLIQVDNMFNNIGVNPYNYTYYDRTTRQNITDTFVTIWSNVPKHMMYPVGQKKNGYTLVLEEFPASTGSDWNLIMYDGGGSKVWCATSAKCNWAGSYGYRFPRNYLLPTDYPTDAVDPYTDTAAYPHNYLNPNYKLSVANPAIHISENQKCGPILTSGQGLTSPNGRFKLILDWSGNLILKDGVRTMWESYTANLTFAQPPYSLQLSNRGSLYLTDKWGGLITNTVLSDSRVRNSSLVITDQGEIQILGTVGNQIWTSWEPVNPGLSGWRNWVIRKAYCYPGCVTCVPKQPNNNTVLYSNGSDYTPWTSYIKAGDKLLPTSGTDALIVTNTSVSIGNTTFFSTNGSQVMAGMILDISNTGRLSFIDANATTASWQVGTFFTGVEPFTVTVEDSVLIIRDTTGNVTYSIGGTSFSPIYWMGNGTCLTAVNSTSIILSDCDKKSKQQQWDFRQDGTIRPRASALLCLDVNGGVRENSSLVLNNCNGSRQQAWNFDSRWMTFSNSADSGLHISNSLNSNNRTQVSSGPRTVRLSYGRDTIDASWQYGGVYTPMNLSNGWNYIFDSVNNDRAITLPTSTNATTSSGNSNVSLVKIGQFSLGNVDQLFTNDNGLLRSYRNPAMCLNNSLGSGREITYDACYKNGTLNSVKWMLNDKGQISSGNSSLCMADFGATHSIGEVIGILPCDDTTPSRWTWLPYQPIYNTSFVPIFWMGNGKCLTAANGGAIQLSTCVKDSPQQLWAFSGNGTIIPKFAPQMCLDVNGSLQEMTPLFLSNCNGSKQQSWSFDSVWMTFNNNANTNLVINNFGASQNDGNALLLYHNDHTLAGSWQYGNVYTPMNPGNSWNYIFDQKRNDLAVTVSNATTDLHLAKWTDGNVYQQFTNDSGLLRLKFNPVMCLDVPFFYGEMVAINSCYQNGSPLSTKWTLNGNNQLVAVKNGICLNDAGGAHSEGDSIVAHDCAVNSYWTWSSQQPIYDTSYAPIYWLGNAKCLTAVNGGAIQLMTCSQGSPQQLWAFLADGTIHPKFNTQKCLDITGSFHDRDNLRWTDCNGLRQQSWSYDSTGKTFNNNQNSDFVINNYGASQNDGNGIVIYHNDHTLAGKWQYGGPPTILSS